MRRAICVLLALLFPLTTVASEMSEAFAREMLACFSRKVATDERGPESAREGSYFMVKAAVLSTSVEFVNREGPTIAASVKNEVEQKRASLTGEEFGAWNSELDSKCLRSFSAYVASEKTP